MHLTPRPVRLGMLLLLQNDLASRRRISSPEHGRARLGTLRQLRLHTYNYIILYYMYKLYIYLYIHIHTYIHIHAHTHSVKKTHLAS